MMKFKSCMKLIFMNLEENFFNNNENLNQMVVFDLENDFTNQIKELNEKFFILKKTN